MQECTFPVIIAPRPEEIRKTNDPFKNYPIKCVFTFDIHQSKSGKIWLAGTCKQTKQKKFELQNSKNKAMCKSGVQYKYKLAMNLMKKINALSRAEALPLAGSHRAPPPPPLPVIIFIAHYV